jgi:hypothetical protein
VRFAKEGEPGLELGSVVVAREEGSTPARAVLSLNFASSFAFHPKERTGCKSKMKGTKRGARWAAERAKDDTDLLRSKSPRHLNGFGLGMTWSHGPDAFVRQKRCQGSGELEHGWSGVVR